MKYGENDLLLLGAGGHAKVIIELIKNYYSDLNLIGLTDIDADKKGTYLFDVEVLGDDRELKAFFDKGIKKVFISTGTVGNYKIRARLFELVKEIGFELINILHPKGIVAGSVKMGCGNVFMANSVVNTEAVIGSNCIINTGSIIEHDCIIGDNTHIATGAKLAGQVVVGDNCMIGIGANIIQGVKIGDRVVVGAGSVVIGDIPPDSIAVGVPARVIKRRDL
jgi:UDP-perosamine 4-acetyltransferase